MVFDEQTDITNSVRFPILVPIKLFQIVFPSTIGQVGDHTGFAQEKQLCAEASSILIWEKADTASTARPPHPGGLAMTSMTFAVQTI